MATEYAVLTVEVPKYAEGVLEEVEKYALERGLPLSVAIRELLHMGLEEVKHADSKEAKAERVLPGA